MKVFERLVSWRGAASEEIGVTPLNMGDLSYESPPDMDNVLKMV